ncbi:MAG: Periplasmic aromatic aldehyde oxidoreductase, molybdenum binding subunit YagR, partial [uncultured Acetobacteraceae bacterium]
ASLGEGPTGRTQQGRASGNLRDHALDRRLRLRAHRQRPDGAQPARGRDRLGHRRGAARGDAARRPAGPLHEPQSGGVPGAGERGRAAHRRLLRRGGGPGGEPDRRQERRRDRHLRRRRRRRKRGVPRHGPARPRAADRAAPAARL